MRSAFAGLLTLALASTAMAQPVVRWSNVVGVITAQGVDNPVADISSGTFAWSAENGRARVNLSTGATAFEVEGLVINGTAFSGTPGPVTQVEGTLVCNAGDAAEAVIDTPPVALSAQGDAEFSGSLKGIPAACNNPLFLVRIVNPAGALGAWIATGVDQSIHGGNRSRSEDR
jgi:hypothetical protein